MIHVKFKNVSVANGDRFRHKQNWSLTLWKHNDGVDENTTVENIKDIINDKFKNVVKLNADSKIIVENNYKTKLQ